jgi:histidinol-phosphate phosphatase family protein
MAIQRGARPTQAVILAGGRGERLRPLTDTRPKPMIEFHGKPFLEYLVEQVRDEGFERATLLVGYRGEQIVDHFADGGSFGIEIEYSHIAAEHLTARRLQEAGSMLDDVFLLMYCDNYWPLRFDHAWEQYMESGRSVQITVYANRDRLTRSNVLVRDDAVAVYDRSRSAPGLAGVDIGYAIVERDRVLPLLPQEQTPFEEAVYPRLVEVGALGAYVSEHRYYSVGSIDRLPVTERFLARKPAVIVDRDGTLNRRPPRAEYVTRRDELVWLPGALDALRLLAEEDYTTIVVSNQAGVNRGALTAAQLESVNSWLRADAAAAGGRIDAIYVCPHDWDEGCECRKPRPGMLFQAQRDYDLDLTRTFFLGDDERDGQAADAAGAPFALISDGTPLLDRVRALIAGRLKKELAHDRA